MPSELSLNGIVRAVGGGGVLSSSNHAGDTPLHWAVGGATQSCMVLNDLEIFRSVRGMSRVFKCCWRTVLNRM